MKIGLISDTHVPNLGKEPPAQVARAFAGVDLILHAGDIYLASCLEWLERIAPVKAAASTVEMQGAYGFGGDPRVAFKQVVEADGYTIGLIQELILLSAARETLPGALEKQFPATESIPLALEKIFGQKVDIVVFGFTHEALVETHQGVLFVNPGSPVLVKQSVRLGTVAILDLTPEGPRARIIDLASLGNEGA